MSREGEEESVPGRRPVFRVSVLEYGDGTTSKETAAAERAALERLIAAVHRTYGHLWRGRGAEAGGLPLCLPEHPHIVAMFRVIESGAARLKAGVADGGELFAMELLQFVRSDVAPAVRELQRMCRRRHAEPVVERSPGPRVPDRPPLPGRPVPSPPPPAPQRREWRDHVSGGRPELEG